MLEIDKSRTCVDVATVKDGCKSEDVEGSGYGSERTIVPMLDITISHCPDVRKSSH